MIAVSSPGARVDLRAWAETQPQETRTPEMVTVWSVLLTNRNGCCSVGPRGTEPKSRDNSSNKPSAHEARADPTAHRPSKTARLYRNMLTLPCWKVVRGAPRRRERFGNDPERRVRSGAPPSGHYFYSPHRPSSQTAARGVRG